MFRSAAKKALPPSTTKDTTNSCLSCDSLNRRARELPANEPTMDPQQTAAASATGVWPPSPRDKALVSTAGAADISMVPFVCDSYEYE